MDVDECGGIKASHTPGESKMLAVAVAVAAAAVATKPRIRKPSTSAASKRALATAAAAAAAAVATTTSNEVEMCDGAAAEAEDVAAAAAVVVIGEPEEPQRAALLAFMMSRCSLSDVQARDVEVGVFNWALARANERRIARNWRNPRFRALYEAKARSVAANMDASSYVANDRLLARIAEGEFLPHDVASMPPENVFPERWREVVETKVRRDEYISTAKPTAMTDQFRCGRCKKRECSFMELQTRSCDEPATLFIQCLSCGHRWRMG